MNDPWTLLVGAAWREFLWGAIAGAFGEGMMHPIDTIKTRIQSQAILTGSQVSSAIIVCFIHSMHSTPQHRRSDFCLIMLVNSMFDFLVRRKRPFFRWSIMSGVLMD